MLTARFVPLDALGTLKASHSHVMIGLYRFADREGVCWPGLRKLAEVCGMSLSRVQRAITEMASLGYLTIKKRFKRSNVYQIAERFLVKRQAGTQNPAGARPGSGTRCPGSGTRCPGSGTDRVPPAGQKVETAEVIQTEEETPLTVPPRGDDAVATAFFDTHTATGENHDDRPTGSKRGTRLQPDWQPIGQDCDFAAELGLDVGDVANAFRDRYLARGWTRHDWHAEWRDFCREVARRASYGGARSGVGGSGAGSILEGFRLARAFREAA